MDLTARQEKILSLLRSEGRVETEDLALRFDVTSQTIRRDLGELCDRGLAVRTHGGAKRIASVANREYHERQQLRATQKEAMASLAASLIPDNCSITLNIGTTTEQVARALVGHKGLVVLSNNINIINTLIGTPLRELILVGGAVRTTDGAIVGQDAVEFISRYKVDFAVIGASALDPDGAVLDFDAREVSVARAILRNARTKILVCDISKFERTAPVRICEIGDLDYMITDREPPAPFRDAARHGDTEILVADESHARPIERH
ncbi:DeoR/GlpR family DNA-binding transcription regulator [Actibacterium ureilyticum]|uniref:DeoR/GlpR family DNA-binding transcription regulator n=1 Tax=Actibacterium ureilyticum TaxID=1590614 RepID=UPI000BAAEFBA|nr:DeoR/GlpR family DNA-binding transcription regulator [Actibacterium ureilyticum]